MARRHLPGLHAWRHTVAAGKVSKTKLTSQYVQKKNERKKEKPILSYEVMNAKSKSSRVFHQWLQVLKFEEFRDQGNPYLPEVGDSSQAMRLESPTSGIYGLPYTPS